MKKNITALLLIALFIIPAYTQEKKKGAPEAAKETEIPELDDTIYREIVLEDFENIQFKDSDIIFQKARNEEYKVGIRDEFPSGVNNSKKYLGVKLLGTKSNAIQIKFPNELVIDQYCRDISVWVYGKKFSGELYMTLIDAKDNTHKLRFGQSLNFHGWRKLTTALPEKVIQSDIYLEQKKKLRITSIIYVPGSGFTEGTNIRESKWQAFYIDDITAMVRAKYVDRQSDDW